MIVRKSIVRKDGVPWSWFRGHVVKLLSSAPRVSYRASISECRVPATRVLEALDIVKHLGDYIVARAIDLSANALGLHQ
jgi:hypothetical protein